ncbi:MAG: Cytochrome bd quinol oxidase, subunit II [Candidatus Nitrospira kreftii]|uniref:Cytochrome bd quinol oxidase, subunit II n=1 Tax=Candidatus Nitrospira kreftii TaxID=2652173 RepID=A0A7S8FEW3_9BACT|nr:MAG: Cytochrome bd quinol oxidase, subunit II [Candidatus Nitrospira kreftii]
MPSYELMVAAALIGALTFYLLFGGADFGAGIWTLFAIGRKGQSQRALIDHAIGPIWEANHVWLIIAVVILFKAFPPAFSVISIRLHIPLTVMLIGIVLRGTAFAIRTHDIASRPDGFTGAPPIWHRIFAWSSLITPTMLGIVLGAIASGRASGPTDTIRETFVDPWLGRFPLAVGLLATALVAYLAAVYLIMESSDPELRRLFRRRAVISGILVIILAGTALFLSHDGAPEIYRGLVDTALGRATMVATALFHLAALWALMTARNLLARFLAGGGAIAILWGWALSQYPYLVEPSVTIYDAAPHSTLDVLLASLLLGSILLLPFLYYLYNLFKGDVLSHPHG